ncbi:MAG: AAA family ATPase, partial [Mycobacterium sp.]
MTTSGVLALLADQGLRDEVDRIAAAAALKVVHAPHPSGHRAWLGASVVLVDLATARDCGDRGLPRRGGIFLIARDRPGEPELEAAVAVGAQQVLHLPAQEVQLVGLLSEAADPAAGRRGAVV